MSRLGKPHAQDTSSFLRDPSGGESVKATRDMKPENTKIITANEAAAIAARLCRVQVIAAYPITPQTPVTEELAAMVERGELNAEYLTVESEHSAMAAVVGASQVGARAFTATSANGLLYMHEVLHWAAGSRVPVVMACVNRGVGAPWTILNDQQDSISQRDTGWVQLYCRNSQEVLDTIIQAYRIAEQWFLPVMVCYDGFVLSHASTPVEIPSQELVDQFLPARDDHLDIFSDGPGNLNPLILSDPRRDAAGNLKPGYMDLRFKLHMDLLATLNAIDSADHEFRRVFDRSWGGVLWTYKLDDALHAIVSLGSLASECTLAADMLRSEGLPVGVVGLRAYRPFPAEALAETLKNVSHVVAIEKDVSYGHIGAVASDLKGVLFDKKIYPQFSSYVAGLGGRDVRAEEVVKVVKKSASGISNVGWMNVQS